MSGGRTKRWAPRVALLLLGLFGAALGALWAVGFRDVDAHAEPLPTAPAYPYDALHRVLRAHVHAGRVDYRGLAADDDLPRFVATLAETGPRSTPGFFAGEDARKAWAIDAYNAAVLFAVARAWPIGSVHDVRGAVEVQPGFGFFYAQRFALDGRRTNLYDFENDVVRAFGDARVHAAINCASASCPTLASEPYLPETLDAQLDAAARAFASEPRHVSVTADAIELSSIYQWFADDFRRDARRLGAGDEVLDWIAHYATPEVSQALSAARAAGLPVRYRPYDWSVNAD